MQRSAVAIWLTMFVVGTCQAFVWAGEPDGWQPARAAQYLEERAKDWFAYASANRGTGATQTTCVSCHTLLPYGLARSALRPATGGQSVSETEQKLLTHVRSRVDAWAELDTPKLRLLYDFNEPKKKESWGTEAVNNAAVLAFDDRYQGRTQPGDITRRAFANLWQVQTPAGDLAGSWDWLDFKYEPWESPNARYTGATLAAIAVGTAPGYYARGTDPAMDAKVRLLTDYLKRGFAGQNLHNRAWALWASAKLEGILTTEERQAVIAELLARQRDDGGWNLASLGQYTRKDGTNQETASDGYATGLILHALQRAGVPKSDPKIALGLAWLRANQAAGGEWRCVSLNKNRDPASHPGKFMTTAATAFAVLALND
jgi:squalene-hopene/tetraprenyl-beta-curcumene cyclase